MQQLNAPTRRLRHQLALEKLEQELGGGHYVVGDKLPSLSHMAKSMGVNHATLRRGLQSLVQRGVLQVRPRVGVFVAETRPLQRKVTRIALGCRSYRLQGTKQHPDVAAYLAGAHRALHSRGWGIQVMFYDRDRLVEELGSSILEQEISGFVICDGGVNERDFQFFKANGIQVASCLWAPSLYEWPITVQRHPEVIARHCVEHLRRLGHQRIAFLTWVNSGDGGLIHRNVNQLILDHRLGDPLELQIKISNPDRDAKWEEIERFFDLSPLPTAVIVSDEFMADYLLAGCARRGIRIPADLSVAALHDGWPQGHQVPLTAPDGIAEASKMLSLACEALALLIDGEPVPEPHVSVTSPVIMKASTGPAPGLSLVHNELGSTSQ